MEALLDDVEEPAAQLMDLDKSDVVRFQKNHGERGLELFLVFRRDWSM